MQKRKTVQTGTQCKIEIVDLGNEGEGIGRAEGFAVFIPGAIPGDAVLAEITQVKKNFAKGKIVEYLTVSPDRQENFCTHGADCGGCGLQNLRYEAQLALKQKWVRDCLERIGGVKEPLVCDIIGMEAPFRYRNKAVFPVGRVTGEEKKTRGCSVGFYRARSNEVVNCETCLLQAEPAERVAEVIRRYVKRTKVPIYDPKTGTGVLRHIIVKTALSTGEVMVILVAAERRLPETDKLVSDLAEALEKLSAEINEAIGRETVSAGPDETADGEDYGFYLESVILNVNKKKGREILGQECITLAGKSTIMDYACGLELEISPLSFYQVNPIQMEQLYAKAAEYAGLTGKETVLDLYCGVGTIGLYMAHRAKKVIGIEAVRAAVLDANRNAVLNGIVNAEYICGKAEEVLPALMAGSTDKEGEQIPPIKADVVLLDPPRAGCDPAVLDALIQVAPERIVYISCDPATLARDVKILCGQGYRFEEAQPVDMFPQTSHVETVVLITRVEK